MFWKSKVRIKICINKKLFLDKHSLNERKKLYIKNNFKKKKKKMQTYWIFGGFVISAKDVEKSFLVLKYIRELFVNIFVTKTKVVEC